MTPIEFHQGMRKHFRVQGNAGHYLDTLFLQLNQIKVDIFALDDLLHERHGDFEEAGLSTSDVILKEYGPKAHRWIQTLL